MIKPADILVLFLCIGTAFGGTIVIKGPMAAGSVTCGGTCWADVNCSSATNCSVTSTTETINGSGTLKFDGGYTHTVQYSDNGGAFTSIANNGTLSWTGGHTLAIKILTLVSGPESDTVIVTDNSTGASVGTFVGTNTHL